MDGILIFRGQTKGTPCHHGMGPMGPDIPPQHQLYLKAWEMHIWAKPMVECLSLILSEGARDGIPSGGGIHDWPTQQT